MMGMSSEVVASGIHINQLYLGKQKLDGCGVSFGLNECRPKQAKPSGFNSTYPIGLRGYASQWK